MTDTPHTILMNYTDLCWLLGQQAVENFLLRKAVADKPSQPSPPRGTTESGMPVPPLHVARETLLFQTILHAKDAMQTGEGTLSEDDTYAIFQAVSPLFTSAH